MNSKITCVKSSIMFVQSNIVCEGRYKVGKVRDNVRDL